jgi:hypothetical protein
MNSHSGIAPLANRRERISYPVIGGANMMPTAKCCDEPEFLGLLEGSELHPLANK